MQLCSYTGSYFRSSHYIRFCPIHYELFFSCLFVGDETFLIVANRITVYHMNIDGTLAGVAIQFDFSSSYLGIDYHYG